MKVAQCVRMALAISVIGSVIFAREELYKITEIKPDLVEISIPQTGQKIYKRTSDVLSFDHQADVSKFTIDVDNIDWDYYADRYTFWQDVHMWDFYQIVVTDTDQDGYAELLGFRDYTYKTVPDGDTLWYDVLYELSDDGRFNEVYRYPNSTSMPWWSGDIDHDGNMEVLVKKNVFYEQYNSAGQIMQSYESPAPDSLATEHNFDVPLTRLTQPNHVTVFDLDKDGEMEMLYYLDGGVANVEPCPASTHIAEYDPGSNSFIEKYCFSQPAFYTSNYAVVDLDLDGQIEFATGGIDGELYILETVGDDTYDLVWEDTLNTHNMYMSAITNDMNWNGKPELWIGGDRTNGGVGSFTNIFCLEANGDNSYEVIYEIEIPDVFSWGFQGLSASDINQDGIDELLIFVEGFVFIVEGTGSMPTEIIYAKKNTDAYASPYRAYYSCTSKDLDNDGYPELLLSMSEGLPDENNFIRFTRIYKPSGAFSSIDSRKEPETFQVIKAFPNPFNASVQIHWDGLGSCVEKIELYNITGQLIKSKTIPKRGGSDTGFFNWDATNNQGEEVNSGVYLARLSGDRMNYVIKLSLLK